MIKYLLFAYLYDYPNGGMGDCILRTSSIKELGEYVNQCVKENKRIDGFQLYDCKSDRIYMADIHGEDEQRYIGEWELVE